MKLTVQDSSYLIFCFTINSFLFGYPYLSNMQSPQFHECTALWWNLHSHKKAKPTLLFIYFFLSFFWINIQNTFVHYWLAVWLFMFLDSSSRVKKELLVPFHSLYHYQRFRVDLVFTLSLRFNKIFRSKLIDFPKTAIIFIDFFRKKKTNYKVQLISNSICIPNVD